MNLMTTADLIYDPNEVGSELVVTDVDGEDLWARVVRRDGNQVSVQLIVPELHTAPSSASV